MERIFTASFHRGIAPPWLSKSSFMLTLRGMRPSTAPDPALATSERAETSSAAIRAAEEAGATESPDAALHLQLAKAQFDAACKMTEPKDRILAVRLLMRSQADAERALALVPRAP